MSFVLSIVATNGGGFSGGALTTGADNNCWISAFNFNYFDETNVSFNSEWQGLISSVGSLLAFGPAWTLESLVYIKHPIMFHDFKCSLSVLQLPHFLLFINFFRCYIISSFVWERELVFCEIYSSPRLDLLFAEAVLQILKSTKIMNA